MHLAASNEQDTLASYSQPAVAASVNPQFQALALAQQGMYDDTSVRGAVYPRRHGPKTSSHHHTLVRPGGAYLLPIRGARTLNHPSTHQLGSAFPPSPPLHSTSLCTRHPSFSNSQTRLAYFFVRPAGRSVHVYDAVFLALRSACCLSVCPIRRLSRPVRYDLCMHQTLQSSRRCTAGGCAIDGARAPPDSTQSHSHGCRE